MAHAPLRIGKIDKENGLISLTKNVETDKPKGKLIKARKIINIFSTIDNHRFILRTSFFILIFSFLMINII